MTTQYVMLVLDVRDATGRPIQQGSAVIAPSGILPDLADNFLLLPAPVVASFGNGLQQVRLVSTDSVGPQPDGWTYTISFPGVPGNPPSFSFYLNYSTGATQYLSSLAQVPAVVPGQSYLPLPSGPATAGYVPIATGVGESSAWGPASGGSGAVSSVFGRTGAVAATAGDYSVGQVTGAAPLASPTFTGTPVAPTAAALTNSTQVATTAYADSAVGVEKTRALAAEALLAPIASPTFTGTPAAPTATAGTNTTQVATTAFTTGAVAAETTRAEAAEALLAPKASPAFTGTPTAPTAAALTDNTQVATTAYADNAVGVETTRAEAAEALKVTRAGDTMTGPLSPKVSSLTYASPIVVNAALANVFTVTLTGATTQLANPTNLVDGQVIRFLVTQDATGGRLLTYGTLYDFGAAGTPTLSAGANATDLLGFCYSAGLSKLLFMGAGFGY